MFHYTLGRLLHYSARCSMDEHVSVMLLYYNITQSTLGCSSHTVLRGDVP